MRLAVVAVVGLLGVLYRDFLADDAYITLAYARNLVEHGAPTLGGSDVHALSSPLWFGLSTVLVSVFGTAAAPVLLKLASALAAVAAGWLGLALVRRLTDDRSLHVAAVVLLLADCWFGRWAWSGMEAPAAAALALGGWVLREDGRAAEAAALLATVGVLVRPELGLCAVVLGIDAILGTRPQSQRRPDGRILHVAAAPGTWRRAAIVAAVGALLVVGWAVLAHGWFGTVLPRAGEVKAGAMSVPAAAVHAAGVLVAGPALALVLVALAGPAVWRKHEMVLIWAAGLTGFYVLQGYAPLSRYLLLGAVCLPAYAVVCTPRAARTAAICAAIVWGVGTWEVALPSSSGDLVRFYEDVAGELDSDDVLATSEIGALGYHGDVRLLDLGGLVLDDGHLPWFGRPRRLLREARPTHSLHRVDIDGLRYTEVLTRDVRSSRASSGEGVTTVTLWALDWAMVAP